MVSFSMPMDDKLWTRVDHYLAEKLVPDDSTLKAAIERNTAAGLPAIDVSALQGRFLYLLAKLHGARRILEIGTLGGYSTICLGHALPEDGKLISLELEERHARVATQNIAAAGLAERVEIRVGPALESLARLRAEKAEAFDFVFIDADKPNTAPYFEHAMELCRSGSVIIADNVVPSSLSILGSATLTTDESMNAMLEPSTQAANTQFCRRLPQSIELGVERMISSSHGRALRVFTGATLQLTGLVRTSSCPGQCVLKYGGHSVGPPYFGRMTVSVRFRWSRAPCLGGYCGSHSPAAHRPTYHQSHFHRPPQCQVPV